MGQLRTTNKRHKRAILALRAGDRATESKLPAPTKRATESVES
jgi:hypothetical protein